MYMQRTSKHIVWACVRLTDIPTVVWKYNMGDFKLSSQLNMGYQKISGIIKNLQYIFYKLFKQG